MADALRLFGMKAIVTGAASGIGEAIVRTFIKHGASVLAVDSDASGIDKHFNALRGVRPLVENIRSDGASGRIAEQAASTLGGIDIVVCNIDIHSDRPLSDTEQEEIAGLLQRRAALLSALFDASLPHLKKSPAGRVINIGCVRSEFGVDGVDGFATAEQSIAALTRRQASMIGKYGITANYIHPGAIMTPGSRRVFASTRALRDHCIAKSAANRLGEPIDVAKVALFLATDDSAFVSGTGIVVDGASVDGG